MNNIVAPIHTVTTPHDATEEAVLDLMNAGTKIAQEKLDDISKLFGKNVKLHLTPEMDEGEIRFYVGVKVDF